MLKPLWQKSELSLIFSAFLFLVFLCCSINVMAQEDPLERPQVSPSTQEVLKKLQSRFQQADTFMEEKGILDAKLDLRGLPQGETLIMDVMIPPRLMVEGVIFGEVGQDTVLLSLRDFIRVLNFPIEYDSSTNIYNGWFLREENNFQLNMNTGVLNSAGQEYKISAAAIPSDEDLMAPLSDMEQWFNMDIDVDVGTQSLTLDPSHPFPATLQHKRRKSNFASNRREPASLPRYSEDDYGWFEVPFIDVNTRTRFRDRERSGTELDNFVNIRTAGEFAKGALTTNSAINDEDGLFSMRVTYLQESADPELLGSLGARRFEVGDLSPTRLPITGNAAPETGVRITNTDPLVSLTLPSTRIEGYYFPGWDIELYRDNSLLAFQQTDEEGYYAFENVTLLSNRNYFRVVAYGPQGEIREEVINIPYDRNRLAETGGVYDISLTFQDRQFYEKDPLNDQDRDTPHLVGFYEMPFIGNSALRFGGRYRQEEGEDKLYGSVGISAAVQETLLNAAIASDEEGELKSEMSATRQFGPHRARVDLDMATDGYNPGGNSTTVNTFSNRYNIEGPLNIGIGNYPRYSGNFRYDIDSNNNKSSSGFVSLNTHFDRLSVNQSLDYRDSDTATTGTEFGGTTALTGVYGKDLFRGIAQYNFNGDDDLESLTAFWKHRFDNQLDGQLQVNHSFDTQELTTYSAQLNWLLDEAVITPRVSYDSEGDVEAVVSTRFSVAQEPYNGDFIMTRDSLTNFGSLSAFVFLDKNGNYTFDEGEDEPIRDAKIIAPQNAGGGVTNESGVAFISRFRPSLITDIYLDNNSLTDPFWISAKEGHSIMPKTGNNVYMEFPVHMAGEIDGTVYKMRLGGGSEPATNLSVALYNQFGELEQKTITGPDGFYLLSQIPPGKYYLTINESSVPNGYGRPLPKIVEIGYDGTIIYGEDLFLAEGAADVLVKIMSAQIDTNDQATQQVFLNLGNYESPLMSAFIWRKLVKNFSYYLGGGELLENANDGHTLRLALPENSISSGYKRCSALVQNGEFCEVEVFLAGM